MALLVQLITLASAFVAGNTLLTLMVAFQDGTIHDGGLTKLGVCPGPSLIQLGEQMSTGNR